jgi:oligosaccharide repeat unit polymerase
MKDALYNPSGVFITWLLTIIVVSAIFFSITPNWVICIYFLMVFVSVYLGNITAIYAVPYKSYAYKFEITDTKTVFWLCTGLWTIAMMQSILPLLSLVDISNPSNTKNLVTEMFVNSEGEGFSQSGKGVNVLINMVLFLIGFPCLPLGAIRLAEKNKAGLIPLLLGSLTSLVSFSRFHMFIYLCIFFYSYISYRNVIGNPVNYKKLLLRMVIVVAILFLGPALLRAGVEDFNPFSSIFVYLFGGMSAFNLWYLNTPEIHLFGDLGGRTFYSLKTWLFYSGVSAAPPNLHYEFIDLTSTIYTNVYSLFRPLIEDFGMIFSLLILYFFSAVSSYFFRRTFKYQRIEFIPICAFLWTASLFIFYTSIFADFRLFLGTVISVMVFKYLYKRKNLEV